MEWISVTDKPLVFHDKNGEGWYTSCEGSGEFIAAVPYNDVRKPSEQLWWIKHCVIEDGKGLCVVGENDNEPAGWQIDDVTHFAIIEPPKQ